jgi:transcriptional regulator with XRE-family HTH domain
MHIKPFREKLGFSQAELAEKCELSQNHISQMERDKKVPSLKVLQKLCEALNVSEAELLNGPSNEGYKVTLNFVKTIEEVHREMMVNGTGAVTLADDGTVIASHMGKLFSRDDKETILAAIDEKLDEALETIERRAARARKA